GMGAREVLDDGIVRHRALRDPVEVREPCVDRLRAVPLEGGVRRDEPEPRARIERTRQTRAGQPAWRSRAGAAQRIAGALHGAVKIGGGRGGDAHRCAVTHEPRHVASAAGPRGGGATAGAWMIAQPRGACDATSRRSAPSTRAPAAATRRPRAQPAGVSAFTATALTPTPRARSRA